MVNNGLVIGALSTVYSQRATLEPSTANLFISAPDGEYPKNSLLVTGGDKTRINFGENTTTLNSYVWRTPVYQLFVDDTPYGSLFTTSTVIPKQSEEKTITVKDFSGNISNSIIIEINTPNGYIAMRQPDGSLVYDSFGNPIFTPLN